MYRGKNGVKPDKHFSKIFVDGNRGSLRFFLLKNITPLLCDKKASDGEFVNNAVLHITV
ncbi:MAG: hypothetical protein JW786_10035 [Desulfobacterales bacterium]|nr:hypothetical protein [Desulfobacterales bacterium]